MRPINLKRNRRQLIDDVLDGMERLRQDRLLAMDYEDFSGPSVWPPKRPSQERIDFVRVWGRWKTGTYREGE